MFKKFQKYFYVTYVMVYMPISMRPEMITQIIRKQLFCVTNVRVVGKLIPRQLVCVIGTFTKSVPLPTLQSETWLVRAKVRKPHLNPPVRMNFLPLALVLKGKARKVHTNRGVQMWFANFRGNQPCFRLECRERY